jgi:hypothetical protein
MWRGKLARWALLVLGIAGVALIVAGSTSLAFRGRPEADAKGDVPGHVQHLEGTNVDRVILTAAAVRRLGITTQPVQDAPVAGAARKVIPYAALLYDADGSAWTYTNAEPLVFVREPVTVESIQGDRVVLTSGPAAGTPVVTVGAIELYGTEFGVSGDE